MNRDSVYPFIYQGGRALVNRVTTAYDRLRLILEGSNVASTRRRLAFSARGKDRRLIGLTCAGRHFYHRLVRVVNCV